MDTDDPHQGRSAEERFLRLWRLIAIGTATALIALTTIVDTFGRLYIDPTFRVSEFLFGTLVAAWVGLLGFEGVSLLRRRNGNG